MPWRILWLCLWAVLGSAGAMELDHAPVDVSDLASLQRGAKLYVNRCAGCHSLKYVRYKQLASDLGITDARGNVLEAVVKSSLMFTGDKITDNLLVAMRQQDGEAWFGIAPPDLSLVARYRGVDWLYTYLRTFYPDGTRPWGVNNQVYPSVAMPHVLADLQAQLGPQEYDRAVLDLVNFLSYVAEPKQLERRRLGVWVLLFVGVFLVFAWLLKREYWKDVR